MEYNILDLRGGGVIKYNYYKLMFFGILRLNIKNKWPGL